MAKRECKISLFISQTARELLDAAVLEFDSPQGKLIDRMIIQFCAKKETTVKVKQSLSKKPSKKFIKPTMEEAGNYFVEKGFGLEMGQQFVDHYSTNGWLVGRMKAPMKDWKAAIRTWLVNKEPVTESKAIEMKTPADCITLLKKGMITSVSQLKEHRKMIETQYMLGRYSPKVMEMLTNIGMAV